MLDNIHDYYVFVRLIAAEQTLGDKLIWEFTRASDNIDGLAEPKQVAGKLGQQVNQRYEKIITELLHQLSFTESATFFSNGIHGWVLDHPRIGLCMKWDSKLRVRSVVPVHLFQRDFTAQVMQHPNDEATTFSLTEDDVSLLATDPAEATVTAVHVVSYTRECPSADAVTTSPPEEDLFAAGGQQ